MQVGDRVRVHGSVLLTPQAQYLWMIGRVKRLLWDGTVAHVEFDRDPFGYGGAATRVERLAPAPERKMDA